MQLTSNGHAELASGLSSHQGAAVTIQTTPTSAQARTGTRAQWLVLAAAFLGWMFDGVEQGVFPLVARPALQDLLKVDGDAQVGVWIGVITALFLLGAAFGGLVFGWLGDRLGRVRAMVLSILTYSSFSGCCYFAQAPWHLGVFRFLSAVGMGGEWSLGVALVMECWPERRRPLLAGAIGAAANLGFGLVGLLGALFAVTRGSWRWVMLAGAAPALLALFIARWVPESEKWRHSLKQGGAGPLREVFGGTLCKRTLLGIAFASIVLIGAWGSVQWLPSWADQLTRGTVHNAKGLTQLLIGAGAVVGSFVGPWLGGKVGRRTAYFSISLVYLLACGYLFRWVAAYGTGFLVMAGLVGATTGAFFGWLPLYLPELFPTRVRATGQGLCYNSGRVFAAAGALQMGELMRYYHGSYAQAGATMTLVYALGLVLVWLGPETKDQPLPE